MGTVTITHAEIISRAIEHITGELKEIEIIDKVIDQRTAYSVVERLKAKRELLLQMHKIETGYDYGGGWGAWIGSEQTDGNG